jgi:hypothetical protein
VAPIATRVDTGAATIGEVANAVLAWLGTS